MTQYSDSLFLGAANTGITTDNNGGTGVGPMGRTHTFDVVPAALAANNIAASQTAAGAGNLALTAGSGVTSATRNGLTVLRVDTPRNVRVTSAGDDSGVTFTVTGWDQYGQKMSEAITGANAGVASGKKAFLDVYTVGASGATASNVTVGTGDVLGLPFRLYDVNHVIACKWASALAQDGATVVAGDATTATTTTGDVRGTVDPSSATNGSRRLTVTTYLGGIASGPDATRAGALGVNQNLAG